MIYTLFILSFLISNNLFADTNSAYRLENNFNEDQGNDFHQPLKYALYSMILPGTGEYCFSRKQSLDINKKLKKRAFVFLGIEAISWGINIYNRDKYNKKMQSYRKYADNNWSFADWIRDYHEFEFEDQYSYLWENSSGQYMGIGESSHYIQFYYGDSNQIIRTTDINFKENILDVLVDAMGAEEDIYSGTYSVEVIKDQHFYENIGKYNEFFSGWADGDVDHISISVTEHGYHTPRSPIKNNYLNSYDKAEKFSDYAEGALWCIYFNHFISMVDAFILAHKFNGEVMLSSSTVFNKKSFREPIGIKLNLAINI